jgi:ABC-type uncharacterized transport system permease subunit
MTRIEKRNLSITLIAAALICGGYALARSGVMKAGVALSFIGSLTLFAVAVSAWLNTRRNEKRN